MIWFSSDWHFSHTNIAGSKVSKWKSGFRDFDNVKQMNTTIIDNINKYVKSDDTLYFLGDFCFGDHRKTPEYRALINCETIHFCRGNHDSRIDDYSNCFTSINDVMSIRHGGNKFFLSHYSHRIWPSSHHGVIHLYGHSHDSIPDFNKSMDVGVDPAYRILGEYRPFSITEILEIMNKKTISKVDHHESTEVTD